MTWDHIISELEIAARADMFDLESATDSSVLFKAVGDPIMLERQLDAQSGEWLVILFPVGVIPEQGLKAALVDCSTYFASGFAIVEGIASLRTVLPMADLSMQVVWGAMQATIATGKRMRATHAIGGSA